jgi:hypothetical protein
MVHKTNLVECRADIDFLDTFSSNSTKDSYKIEKNGLSRELKLPNGEKVEDKLQGLLIGMR